MKVNEEDIKAQIDTVNDMLYVITKELNELETIDDYTIELEEPEYKIIVTVTKHLENKGE